MIKFLIRYATWKNTIILLVAQFAVQSMILFVFYPLIGGHGVPLDMRSGLSVPEIQQYVMSIGPQGRIIYALNEGIADMLYPVLYSAAYGLLFLRLLIPMAGASSRWLLPGLLPFAIAGADICENISIIGSLATYQNPGAWFHSLVFFNSVKGALMLITMAALFIVICARLLFLLFARRKRL